MRKDGTCYVAIVTNYKSYKRVFNTGVYLKPSDWDEKKAVVRLGVKNGKVYQQHILKCYRDAEDEFLNARMNRMSESKFKNSKPIAKDQMLHEALEVFFANKVDDVKDSTRKAHGVALSVIKKNMRNVPVSDLLQKNIEGFREVLLKKGYGAKSINNHVVYVKGALKLSKKSGVSVSDELFDVPMMKVPVVKREPIDEAQLQKMWKIRMESRSVQLFFLSLFCCGVDFRDLKAVLDAHDVVMVERQKTKKVVIFQVQPEARSIMQALKDSGFKILLGYQEYRNQYNTIIYDAKRVNDLYQTGEYTIKLARHTWVNVAVGLGVLKETVAKALAHTTHTITDVYISHYNFKDVDAANRMVIDHVMKIVSQ